MIRIARISDVKPGQFDEVWAIVRSMKSASPWIKQVPGLSPKKELFFEYRRLANAGRWDRQAFENIYVPKFISDLCRNQEHEYDLLNELYYKDKDGLGIALVCFCTDEEMCHRSIIAGLLQGAGCNVVTNTGNNYSAYYDMWQMTKAKGC